MESGPQKRFSRGRIRRFFALIFKRPVVASVVLSLSLVLGATAGSLTPPGAVGSTMNTLAEIYNAIAGTFDSSAITANQNGSLIENLKYIESNLAWASGSNNIWNLNSGNVGIGTTSPDAKFEVVGLASVSSLTVNGSPLRVVTSDSLDFDEFVDAMTLDADTSIASAGFDFALLGDVGIGVVHPEGILDVRANASDGLVLFRSPDSTGGNVNSPILRLGGSYDAIPGIGVAAVSVSFEFQTIGDASASRLTTSINSFTGTTLLTTLQADGNLGIGAAAPEQKLEVAGNILASISGNADLTLRSTDSEDAQFTFRSDGASERLDILGSVSQAYLTILKDGNVGIGTTTPDTLFEVTGGTTTQTLFGAGLTSCDGVGDKLAWSISGLFSCGSDQTGGGAGGGSAVNIREIGYGASFNDLAVATLSFDGGHFALTASGTEDVSIKLDWTNGPASRTLAETITGAWTFSNGASISSQLEVLGVASISNALWATSTGVFAGNVGIGTTEPLARLNVLGTTNSLRLSYNFENYGELYVDSTGTLFIDSVRTAGPTNPHNVVLTTTGGNVGIGEVLPDAKLEVTGGVASISNTLYVESGGNVGIGNTTPNAKLDVAGAVMASTSTGDAEFILNAASIVGGKFTMSSGTDGIEEERLRILNASDVVLMQIASGGTIDILPAELSAPVNANLTFHGSQGGNDYAGMSTTTGQFRIQVEGSSDTFYLEIGRDSSVNDFSYLDSYWLNELSEEYAVRPLILNPSGGKVSIGTTAPIAALEVRPATSFTGPLFLVASNSNERFRITSTGDIVVSAQGSSVRDYVLSAERIGSPIADDRFVILSSGSSQNRFWLDTVGSGGAALSLATNGVEHLALGQTSSNSYGLTLYNNQYFRIQTGDTSVTQKFILTTDGRIAVGTTATASFFTILGSDGATGTNGASAPFVLQVTGGTGGAAQGAAGTGGEGASMSFTAGNGGAGGVVGGGGYGGVIRLVGGDGGDGGSFDGGGGNILLLPGSGTPIGRVGIRTTLPSNTLHVLGSTSEPYQVRLESATGMGQGILLYEGATTRGSWTSGAAAALNVIGSTGVSHFTVRQSSGNVGVGTTDPLMTFHVVGTVSQPYQMRLEAVSGQGIGVQLYEATTPRGSWTAGSLAIFNAIGADSNSRLTVRQSGNVGISNTDPAALFHVGSTAVADGTTLIRTQDINSTCNFTADAGSPTCGSDARLKKDITPVSDSALERLTALEVVTYRWKTDSDTSPVKTGFIAQNVQEYFPDLVSVSSWGDGEPALFLSQSGLIPYLVKAVQEQQEMIDALRAGFNSTESVLTDSDSSLLNRIVALFTDILGIEFGQGSVAVERLCVGSVCVTEEQFMEVFGSGAEPTETPEPSSETTPTPLPDESSGPEPEPSAEASVEPSPEPTPEPEETAEPSSEPEPEPSTDPAPEVQTAPLTTEDEPVQN